MLLEFVALTALIYPIFGQGKGQAPAPRLGVIQPRPGELPLPGLTLNGPLPQPRMMPRGLGKPGMEMMSTRNVFGRTKKSSREGPRSPKFGGTSSRRRPNKIRVGMPVGFEEKTYGLPKPALNVLNAGTGEELSAGGIPGINLDMIHFTDDSGRTKKNLRKRSRSPKYGRTSSGKKSNEIRTGTLGGFKRKPYVPPKSAVRDLRPARPDALAPFPPEIKNLPGGGLPDEEPEIGTPSLGEVLEEHLEFLWEPVN